MADDVMSRLREALESLAVVIDDIELALKKKRQRTDYYGRTWKRSSAITPNFGIL